MRLSEIARARAFAAVAALAAYAEVLRAHGWPRDDRWLILEHPLLRAGLPGARELLTSGYVQPLMGASTPIQEWRPVLSLSFLLQRLTTGFAPFPLHAVNLALHIAVAVLVFECLRARFPVRAAAAGAALYAVLPVHAEVVAYLTSRSEELAALSALGAWRLLGAPAKPGPRRIAAGALIYAAGGLSKESALLFPLFLMLADWTLEGKVPWSRERRRVHLAMAAAAALVLAGRVAVLPALAAGGVPYFAGTPALSRLLTLAKFWTWSYARPAMLSVGLCADFSRPLIADARPDDLVAWACLLTLTAVFSLAVRAAARRQEWGFWLIGPCLFLLPTSQLLMNLDVIGAQRFLYLPALALAAAAAALFARAETRAPRAARAGAAGLLLALGARAAVRAADWRDAQAYDRAAVACNPVAAKARAALGLDAIRAGREAEGETLLTAARNLEPDLYEANYNLARLDYGRGDQTAARPLLDAALRARPDATDALTLSALLEERAGRLGASLELLARAAAADPDDATARYDLARALARVGRTAEARAQLRAYLRLSPDDAGARAWLAALGNGDAR
ncbi:MAG: tetratricopeptide repeat protein [Elusimicrobia bacterium]|nr:tetratricopeptide repeat protein [Elusimicrobiota bacterium]